MKNQSNVKPDLSWILANYENAELEKKAMKESIDLYANQKHRQQVVNDALQTFRNVKIDESNKVELLAKEVLINVVKTKELSDEQKVILVHLLVERRYKGYDINYAYIFDKQVA